MKKTLAIMTVFSFLAFSSMTVAGGPVRAVIPVKGLSCPFCAYGLEKKLKAMEGVEDFTIDMAGGKVTVVFADGDLVEMERLREAVEDAGFTPGRIEVEEVRDEDE